jgi:hypothetical protein
MDQAFAVTRLSIRKSELNSRNTSKTEPLLHDVVFIERNSGSAADPTVA